MEGGRRRGGGMWKGMGGGEGLWCVRRETTCQGNNAKAQVQQLTTDSTSVAGKAGSGALAVKLLAKATPASKTPARLAVSAAKDAGNAPC